MQEPGRRMLEHVSSCAYSYFQQLQKLQNESEDKLEYAWLVFLHFWTCLERWSSIEFHVDIALVNISGSQSYLTSRVAIKSSLLSSFISAFWIEKPSLACARFFPLYLPICLFLRSVRRVLSAPGSATEHHRRC